MNVYEKCTILICVIILTNGARIKNKQGQKCKRIRNFRGGSVYYEGERKVDSKALYSCSQAFSLFPRNVDYSVCGKNLEWDPAPPKCHKKAVQHIPNNGYISEGKKDFLLHLESYKICCNQGFEVQRDGVMISKSCVQIKNLDGVLVPKVQCVEERCDPSKFKMINIEFKNGSLVTTKIASGTDVILSCKAGYGFYRYDKPMRPQIKRTCLQGRIERVPKCQEAKCLFSGYPSSRYTYHREYLSDARLIADDQYIDSGQAVEVYCYRTDIFELYVNASQTYPKHFTTECRLGKFDKKKEEFPICIEKGCVFNVSSESCFRTDDQDLCKPNDFKISSGTSLLMGCNHGYRLYRTYEGVAVEANETMSVECSRGSHDSLEGYKCIPDDIVNVLKGQGDRYPGELDRVSCRYLIMKSDLCTDPCLVPEIPFGLVKEAQSDDQIKFEIGHNTSATFICEEGFHFEQVNSTFVRSFESQCNLGIWTNLISSTCKPDPCVIKVREGTLFYHGSTLFSENDGQVQSLQNGTEIQVVCENGYKIKGMDTSGEDDHKGYTTCDKGQWTHDYYCIPEECSAPKVKNALSLIKDVYEHTEHITLTCEKGFHIYENMSTIVRSLESECNLGNWTNEIPEECKPDSCYLQVREGTSLFNGPTQLSENDGQVHNLQNGTEIEIVCKNGYKIEIVNNPGTSEYRRYSTCVKGNWTHNFNCVPEGCRAPEVINANPQKTEVYEHLEKITIFCEEGFHIDENMSTIVRSMESECNLGNWTHEIPEECKPDPCHLEVPEGTSIFSGSTLLPENTGQIHTLRNGTIIEITCRDGYKMEDKNSIGTNDHRRYSTCVHGRWTRTYLCIPEACPAPDVMNAVTLQKEVYSHTENISLTCEEGFHFYQNISTVVRSFESECNLGKWVNEVPHECTPDGCVLNILAGTLYYESRNNDAVTGEALQENGTTLLLKCSEEFDIHDVENDFILDNSNNATITCSYGDWSADYYCRKRCVLPNNVNAMNIQNGTQVSGGGTFVHGESVNVTCHGQADDDVILMSCANGHWQPEVSCPVFGIDASTYTSTEFSMTTKPSGCVLHDDSGVVYITNGIYAKDGQTFANGEIVNVTCEGQADDVISMICENGRWEPEVNCSAVGTTSSTSSVTISTVPAGCKLSTDRRYQYEDSEGQEMIPGTTISSGTTLTVKCITSYTYLFLAYNDYGNDTGNGTEMTSTTVTCTGNELSSFELDCEEVEGEECTEIENGDVSKQNGFYFVTCHEGFASDAGLTYTCENGKLLYGKEETICKPQKCIVPPITNWILSVTNDEGVVLSSGSAVDNEQVITFDCSGDSDSMLEPRNRKFKCLKGRWIEDDNDDADWKFGNNGSFPECREAKCEPECKNDGVCYKDNVCQCKTSTEGPRCENFICEDECFRNGGQCGNLGQCECPSRRTGENCRKFTCLLPSNVAKLRDKSKKVYEEGETISNFFCDSGYKLSSRDSMTCQYGGTWSTVVECIKVYCIFPSTAATYKDRKRKKFDVGNTITNFHCDTGYKLTSQDNMTCLHNGTWSTVVKCVEARFDSGHSWQPIAWMIEKHILFVYKSKWMTLNFCKLECIKDSSCVAIFYRPYVRICTGYSVCKKSYFKQKYGSWNSPVYLRNI